MRAEHGRNNLTITVTPEVGGTVSGIEYVYDHGYSKVTKTGAGPWYFEVTNNKVLGDDHYTELERFYGIVVNYTNDIDFSAKQQNNHKGFAIRLGKTPRAASSTDCHLQPT